MSYDAWKTTEPWSYWDEEPPPRCLRCGGKIDTPTGPFCFSCARTIDEQRIAGFNPYQKERSMRRHEALPSKYLGKDDFPKPVLCEIHTVVMEEIEGDSGKRNKPVIFFGRASDPQVDLQKGLILNATNWDIIAEIRGEDPDVTDTESWRGMSIVVFFDSQVRFGNKRVGGLRIRAPKSQTPAAPVPEPEPEPEPLPADDAIPF